MKNKLKELIFETFFLKLGVLDEQMTDLQKRRISNALTLDCLDLYIANDEGFKELYQDLVLEYEQNRKIHQEDVLFIQDNAKKILTKMKDDGFINYKYDEKSKQKVMISRTSVVNDIVIFLNQLNTRIVDYYVKVYKANEKDEQQTTLF